ncbi:MAG: EAL domain-containing protein, partial [Campylobacterales bacterium]|nr:EAL domain-containing protein [Campylobacterales bacterium]
MSSALVGRQPILGSNGDIFAYELLFRSGAANSASVTDNASATANVLLNTLNSIGLDKLIGDKFAFINVDENFLASKVLDGLPKDKFVIEILETVKVDQNIIDRVSSLKNAGFTFAIDDIDLHPEQIKNFEPLFEFASVLKIDLLAAGGADKIKQKIDYFRGKNFKFLAEKVENASEYEKCKAMGFELFQGYFFEKPTIIEGKKIDSSEVSVIKILKKVQSGSDLGE